MTGIPRKEVQKLKRLPDDIGEDPRILLSPLADLLSVWATAEEYSDSDGTPRSLDMHADGPSSFDGLVRRCMGDVPSGAVRAELLRLGVARISANNKLELVRRSLIPPDVDTRLESAFLYSLRGLTETIAKNIDPKTQPSERLFERFVESRELSEPEVAIVRRALALRLTEISEELDDMMNEGTLTNRVGDVRRVGVGIFYTE